MADVTDEKHGEQAVEDEEPHVTDEDRKRSCNRPSTHVCVVC